MVLKIHKNSSVVRLTGIEPVTPSFGNWYSIQLSYRRYGGNYYLKDTSGHFTLSRQNDRQLRKRVRYPAELQTYLGNICSGQLIKTGVRYNKHGLQKRVQHSGFC